MDHLQEHLRKLEETLLQQSVRANAQEIDQLLADDFFEFGVSGSIWTKQAVIDALKDESFFKRSISNFTLAMLADNVALVTYRVHRHETEQRPSADSLRCSIWKIFGTQWKMIFHQGTLIPVSTSEITER